MHEDALFNLGFLLGMISLFVLQRGVKFWRGRWEQRRSARAELPGEEKARVEEMRALHERLAVLERIATDPAVRTAREIEELR